MRARHRGLTLIEVVVATAVFAVAALSFIATFGSSLNLDHLNRERSWAREECQRQMEAVLAAPFANVSTFGQAPLNAFDVGFDVNGSGNKIFLKPVPPATHVGTITVDSSGNPGGGDAQCAKVTVTATWLTATGTGNKNKIGSQVTVTLVANVADR